MQSPSLYLTKNFTTHHHHHHLGFHHSLSSTQNSFTSISFSSTFPKPCSTRVIAQAQKPNHKKSGPKEDSGVRGNKENVWSVDNELAKVAAQKEKARGRKQRGRRMVKRKRGKGGRVIVTGAMLVEVETVLQTQEPVIKPVWNTFASSLSGIWKGVGAVFSPITAEMEPIEISNRNENLYDCYTLSRIEAVPSLSGAHTSQIQRKVNWVTLNPYGEIPHQIGGRDVAKDGSNDLNAPTLRQHKSSENITNHVLPTFESFDFERSDVMEEDIMSCEPGLVYFENGTIFSHHY